MAKTAESYKYSRTNSLKHGIAVKGPIRCRGIDGCAWGKECPVYTRGFQLPDKGDYCVVELLHAAQLCSTLRQTWQPIAHHVEGELDDLVFEAVEVTLQRERAHRRLVAAWDLVENEDWDALLSEQALCDRYYAAALNRWASILARVNGAWEKLQYERWRLEQFSLGMMQNTEDGAMPMRGYPGPEWKKDQPT